MTDTTRDLPIPRHLLILLHQHHRFLKPCVNMKCAILLMAYSLTASVINKIYTGILYLASHSAIFEPNLVKNFIWQMMRFPQIPIAPRSFLSNWMIGKK